MIGLTSQQLYDRLQGVTFREQEWNAVKVKRTKIWTRVLDRKRRNIFFGQFAACGSLEQIDFFAIIKLHHHDAGPEFLTMKTFWNQCYSFRSSTFTMPEPWLWLPEYKLLVTEYIKGKRLSLSILRDQLPFSGFRNQRVVKSQLHQVADWLLDFQKKTLQKDKFDLSHYFRRVRNLAERMEEEWKQIAKEMISDSETSVNFCDPLLSVGWHGDFLHRNVLLAGEKTVLVDWEGQWKYQSVHPLHELFVFASNLECLARPFNKVFRIFRQSRVQYLSDIFVERYWANCFFPLRAKTLKIVYRLFLIEFVHNYLTQRRGLSFLRTKENDLFMKSWLLRQREREFPFHERLSKA
jgi:hypothetical protein